MTLPAPSTVTLPSISMNIPRSLEPESLTFTLKVPLSELAELTLRPVRWMLLVAWGLVNCEGRFQDQDGVELLLDMAIDQLKAGAVYTFLPGGDESFLPVDLENCQTKLTAPSDGSLPQSELSSSSPPSTTKSTFSGGNYKQILSKRDGGRCMFTGRYAVKGTARVHVLPERLSRNMHLVAERRFAITHPLDPRNTIVLLTALHEQYDTATGFVLATDDRFLRDEDVPPPLGAAPPTSSWRDRAPGTGQASCYIWQSLRRIWHEDHATFTVVQLNQRAHFASGEAEWYPCPRTVNYVYAAMMVHMYLELDDDVCALLFRPDAAESGSASKEGTPRRCTRDRARLAVPKLSPVELMMRLTR